jgi:UDP-glucose 4-epimerase
MKKAVVFGAGGFIGRHVCLALAQDGYLVHAVDISQLNIAPNLGGEIVPIQADVTLITDFQPYLDDADLVVYLVCTLLPEPSNERPVYDIESNLLPVIRLLETLRYLPHVKVLFASSGGTVYGQTSQTPITESCATDPLCSYGIVKLTTEKYLRMYSDLYGVSSLSLRIANPYGPGQNPLRPQGVVGVFLHMILQNKAISIWGDGELVRDYVWIEDVAHAFVAAANYNGSTRVFNIGTGVGTSLNQLLKLLFSATGRTVSVDYLSSRAFDVPSNILSSALAKSELNWEPSSTLEVHIRNLVNS